MKNIELPEKIIQAIEKIVVQTFPTVPFEIIFSFELNARVTEHPEHLSDCFEELSEIEKFRTPRFPEDRDDQAALEFLRQMLERENLIFEAVSQSISTKLQSSEALEQVSKIILETKQK